MTASDRRPALLAAYDNASVIVAGVTVAQLGQPTPCPKYNVAALIDHIVEAGHRAAALGRGQSPPPGDNSPHVELTDAPSELKSAGTDAAAAWAADASLEAKFTMPWGEQYSGSTMVDMYTAELAAHAWDLARATGQIDRLNPALAASALDGAKAMIRPEYRNMVEPGAPFGSEVPAPDGADDWDRLVAFMGRDPRAQLD